MTLFEWMNRNAVTNRQLARQLGVSEEFARLLRLGRRGLWLSPVLGCKLAGITHGEVTAADCKAAYVTARQWAALRRSAAAVWASGS